MGILTAYIAYKYGKSKERRVRSQEEAYWAERCDLCGHRRDEHVGPGESCPQN
jgi:hypothetical protein